MMETEGRQFHFKIDSSWVNPSTWLSLPLFSTKLERKPSDRLRFLYISLLRHINIPPEALSLRAVEKSGGFFPNFFGLERRRSKEYSRDDVAVAFRLLAATQSVEGAHMDEEIDMETVLSAQRFARRIERSVVDIIKDIGETLVCSERPRSNGKVRDDFAFAYFCEKAMLPLLADIAKEIPVKTKSPRKICGIVWSAKVKAQVFRTVNFLVSGVKDKTALYYLLSHHTINHLILSFLPLSKWSDPALKEMLYPYTEILKTLSVQLGAYPDLFLPLFTFQKSSTTELSFPLFTAILQVANSRYAGSDSYVHATCLNLLVGLMRISDNHVHSWVISAKNEQHLLCDHLCQQLVERFEHIADNTTGPIVDGVRHNGLVAQIGALDDLLDVVSDILWCKVVNLNTRLCESLLRVFVRRLLFALAPTENRQFLDVGVSDWDVVPAMEAHAQTAMFFLARIFLKLDYPPFTRMLAVALFHPSKPSTWGDMNSSLDMTASLNSIVLETATGTSSNNFRDEVVTSLTGKYGEWRFMSAAALLENALIVLDYETLSKVEVVPENRRGHYPEFEGALSEFLAREHKYKSIVSVIALECASSVTLEYVRKVQCQPKKMAEAEPVEGLLLRDVLESTKHYFFAALLDSSTSVEMKDVLVRVVKTAVMARYRATNTGNSRVFTYSFTQNSHAGHRLGAECLVRILRGVPASDTERFRFLADMAIHFRAVCRVANRAVGWTGARQGEPILASDPAGDLGSVFGFLMNQPAVGSDIELRGRTTFPFAAQVYDGLKVHETTQAEEEANRSMSENMIFRSSISGLVLVVDPSIIVVVKPFSSAKAEYGSVICAVPLVDIVAAATDDERLHVAVRHEDLGFLIKNGNMLLTFESPGTCLVASQYLDRCRKLIHSDLHERIVDLLSPRKEAIYALELKHSRTF